MKQLFANESKGTLAQPLSAEGLSFILQSGQAATFPTPGTDEYFIVKLSYLSAFEIISVDSVQNDTLVIHQRELDNTTAQVWPIGTSVEIYLSAGTLDSLIHEDDQTGHFKTEELPSQAYQTVFTLLEGEYPVGQRALEVFINGVRQGEDAYTEIDSKTFALKEELMENEVVGVRYLTTLYTKYISAASVSYFTPDLLPVDLQSYIRSLEERIAKLENS